MGIIDELDSAIPYKPAKKSEAEPEFRPSSYNPLYAYPENLAHLLKSAGHEIGQGVEELGKGEYLKGAFHTGMGALGGFYSPLEAGVQNITQPLSDVTGAPEWALTGAAMLPVGYAGYKGLAGGARRLMGIGGTEAAPMAEAASAAEPRIGATNKREWERSYDERKKAYEEGVAGRRSAQMEEAASRTPPASLAERFFPETPVEDMKAARGEFGYPKEPWAKPGPTEEMMLGGQKLLPPPAIRLPDQSRKWAKPGPVEESYLMPGLPKWQKPGGLPQEEPMFGGRRMFPEQQIPDYTLGTFAGKAAERAGQMRGEQEAFRGAIPQMDYGTRPDKRIERPTSVAPSIEELSKEAKLAKLSELSSERRFFPEQASTEDLRGMTGRAAGRASEMKAERDASRIPNTPAPHTRQIRRPEEEMPPSLGKEEKLSKLESESMRSIDDAVRTLNAGGMSATDAQKHILNNIRAGRMTAVRPNGAPLTKQEAKLIRSLKGLGGVSWIRG
jgi:hypothetical protein